MRAPDFFNLIIPFPARDFAANADFPQLKTHISVRIQRQAWSLPLADR